jgi:hypothetical protein
MTRALVLAAGLASWMGCENSITANGQADAPVSDGRVVVRADAPRHGDAATTVDAGFTCRDQVTTGNTNGHHNAGMDCMDSCHDHGFTIAGTLYSDAAGTQIVSGATISVYDAFGNEFDVVSQTNGNFYTAFALEQPLTIFASECPTIQMMSMQITADAQTGCNQTSCHASNASPGRVHLP